MVRAGFVDVIMSKFMLRWQMDGIRRGVFDHVFVLGQTHSCGLHLLVVLPYVVLLVDLQSLAEGDRAEVRVSVRRRRVRMVAARLGRL